MGEPLGLAKSRRGKPVTTDDRGDRESAALITWADHIGHEGRIIRLDEWRINHEKVHEQHVATQAWVYKKAFLLMGGVGAVIATLAAALMRAIIGA